ncbi:hypothetical protein Nepgr_005127 [Nepenthes gracilis]|uniref:GDSL esterase/lipase EXL3 n=1 Tax=Nepenthes gracilis TaxID=150966 RepID=A0AAD3S2L9_NEPGR|nr:hypothetical protein Nepgr_005127 [Nepenthes gracilis]
MQSSAFSSTSAILLLSVTVLLCSTAAVGGRLKLGNNVTVAGLLAFGDSIIDPGNNNNLKTVAKCNFPPYGKDFMGGVPTGRFSNGRIPTDLIVEALGLKEYLPAYLDPNLNPQDFLTGVSFASGATGFDPMTSKIVSVLSLSDQLNLFKEYLEKLESMVGEERKDFIISNSLFLVVASSDDIANTYFDTPFRRAEYNIDAYTDLMVNSASSFVKALHGLGARRMGLFSAPPLGCLPSQRTIGGGPLRECAKKYNDAAELFNSKLSAALDSLDRELPNSTVLYIDIYNPLLDLIQNPQKYGFEVVDKGCCGTGTIEVSILCTKLDAVCPDTSKVIFWDSYHPTERAYTIIIDALAQKYINKIFAPKQHA